MFLFETPNIRANFAPRIINEQNIGTLQKTFQHEKQHHFLPLPTIFRFLQKAP